MKNGEDRKSFWTEWNRAAKELLDRVESCGHFASSSECRSALHKRWPLHAAFEYLNLHSSIEALEAHRSEALSKPTAWLRTERAPEEQLEGWESRLSRRDGPENFETRFVISAVKSSIATCGGAKSPSG